MPPPTPAAPTPAPDRQGVLAQLRGGLDSWLKLIRASSYRAAIGSQQLPGARMLLVNHPSLVKRVLVEEVEQFPKHPYTFWMLEPLIGRAAFSVNGEEWRQQRLGGRQRPGEGAAAAGGTPDAGGHRRLPGAAGGPG